MKILLLQRMIYIPSFGGANKANRLLMEGFAQKGHEVHVVAPALGSHGALKPEEFFEAVKSRGGNILRVSDEVCVCRYNGVEIHATLAAKIHLYAQQCIQTFKPDRVLVTSEDPGQVLLESALAAAPDRTVYIVHTPLQLPFGPAGFLGNTLQTELIRKVSGIITVSNYVKDYMRQWAGLDSTVISFPVYGAGPFHNFGLQESGFVTLINPCAYKGISIFLELAKRLPEVPFAAVPTWGTTAADYAALQQFRNIVILKPTDKIDEIFARTRMLLMPSLWTEAFPLLPVEAMLRGIPVIASDAGGLPEAKLGVDYVLPVNPITQYLQKFDDRDYPIPVVPEQNMAPWEAVVRRMVSDRDHYRNVSAESRQKALEFVSRVGIEPMEKFLETRVSSTPYSILNRLENGLPPTRMPPEDIPESLGQLSIKKRELLRLRVLRSNAQSKNPEFGTL